MCSGGFEGRREFSSTASGSASVTQNRRVEGGGVGEDGKLEEKWDFLGILI